jgi:Family of unknown function (DUF5320)
MPRFDGTGPEGKGPMTGGKRGQCQNSGQNNNPDSSSPYLGAGREGAPRGCGRGRQRGRSAGIGPLAQFQTSDQKAF